MSLDELLDRSSPTISCRDENLTRELRDIVAASETAAPPRRLSLRAGVAAATAAGILGVGSMASASGLLDGWLPWTTGGGTSCELQLSVGVGRPDDGEYPRSTFSADEIDRAEATARNYLSRIDLSAIDRDAAIQEWRIAEAKAQQSQSGTERQPTLTGDDQEVTAVQLHVTNELREYLASRGMDIRAVRLVWGNRCGS